MNRASSSIFSALLSAARPLALLAGLLLYALGGGIATYLGHLIDWSAYWTGQAAVTVLQLSSYFLREYFDRAGQPPFEPPRPPSPGPREQPEGDRQPAPPPPRVIFLQVALTALTAGAVLAVLLLARGQLPPAAGLFLVLAFVLSLAYAVPPFRLVYSGYGELVLAVLLANVFPALAFSIQTGELHRLLAMLTFPLTFLYLALALARSLPGYLDDIKHERQTMLARLGWQRGINLHNVLIAAAYILLAVSVMAGLPWRLAYPAFLALPVALFQIWQMNSIAGGARPRWRLLALTAMATLGFTAYFMNLALWTD